jgi:hypothetical protein
MTPSDIVVGHYGVSEEKLPTSSGYKPRRPKSEIILTPALQYID